MKIEKYTRKKFVVDAVQVTADNMPHVADWCGGIMKKGADGKEFIQVQVFRALNDRQKQAYSGDWVLRPAEASRSTPTRASEPTSRRKREWSDMGEEGMSPRRLCDDMIGGTEPKQDLDRRSINDYMGSLNGEQERLSELLDILEGRIRDILGPERPEKAVLDGTPSPELSPMAHWLDGMVYRQNELSRRLAAIVERVEL